MRSNPKRERSWSARSLRFVFTGARGLAAARSRFEASNPKRAHPPIPPRGRALTLRPRREVEARALRVRARSSRGLRPGRRYFLVENGSRGPREQRPTQTDFVSAVRSGFQGGHGARPVGPGANGRRRAYRTTTSPPRRPRAAFLGVWGQPRGRGQPRQP